MNRFAGVLSDLMREHDLDQVQLASLTTLEQTAISRLLRSITKPDTDHLAAILTAFTDPSDRFRLVHAYIQDKLPDNALKHLEIHPAGETLADSPSLIPANVPPRIHRALTFLLAEMHDIPSIGDVFTDLARALGWEDKPTGRPGAKVKYPTHRATTQTSKTGIGRTAVDLAKKLKPGG